MVGRDSKLKELKTFLDNAREGNGNTVFITGEAGVGKTRLMEELKGYARDQDVDVLQGWSLYESLTPYMPFLEALRSGGLESLFADEAPRVEAIYLVSHSGLSIKEVIREETKLDPDIFTGMLTAVGDFVKDSLSILTGTEKEGSLNSLGYENYRIIIESLGDMNLAVILTGRENEFLVNDMKEVLVNVDQQFGSVIKEWDGNEKSIEGIQHIMEPLITSGKFDGIDYVKDNPKIKRNRLFENILLGIERHTKVNPSLLCIEDLQWSDPSSMALMHYVARNTRKCNLLILGTYRPEDVITTKEGDVHHLIETMQMMNREDLYHKIELGRLEEKHMDEMLSSFFEKTNFPDEFNTQLYKETEGNPFFIISLIRLLIEEGIIEYKDDIWILTKELSEANIPSKVYDVVIRRLYRVKEKQKEILEYAAIIGEEFSSDVLMHAMKLNKIDLLKELRTLEQNHKLIHSIEPKYKFDHAKIKEVLVNQIPTGLKKEYHEIIGETIESLNKDHLDKVMGDLAFHFYNCANKERALPYLLKVGEKAKNDYSNEEAIEFYEQALELEINEHKRSEIYESLGGLHFYTGDYETVIESFENVLKFDHGRKKKADILVRIGYAYDHIGRYDEVLKKGSEALEIVKSEECKEKAYALRQLGFVHSRLGNIDKAFENFNMSLEIGKKINDQKGIADTIEGMGLLHEGRDDFEKAIEMSRKSLKIKEKIGDLWGIAMSALNIGFYYARLGDFDKALECHMNNMERINRIGNQGLMTYTNWSLAEVYFGKGDIEKSLYFTNQTFELSQRIGFEEAIAASYRLFGMNYGYQENWDESIKNFEKSIKIFNEMGYKVELRISYQEFGSMWKAKGDSEKAKHYFDKANNIFKKLKPKKHIINIREAFKNHR
jgi:tetratricopeptide (TPR) repeat protein